MGFYKSLCPNMSDKTRKENDSTHWNQDCHPERLLRGAKTVHFALDLSSLTCRKIRMQFSVMRSRELDTVFINVTSEHLKVRNTDFEV